MPEDPITLNALMQYHREVLLPDVKRLLSDSAESLEQRLRDEMHAGFDALVRRIDRLETEYQMLIAGLKRDLARQNR